MVRSSPLGMGPRSLYRRRGECQAEGGICVDRKSSWHERIGGHENSLYPKFGGADLGSDSD